MPIVKFLANRQHPMLQVEVPEGTTLLEAAKEVGAAMGDACGGNCACSTCHVYIADGEEQLSEQQDNEADRIDLGFDVRANSRLGCQCEVLGGEVMVEITDESIEAYENEHPDKRPLGPEITSEDGI